MHTSSACVMIIYTQHIQTLQAHHKYGYVNHLKYINIIIHMYLFNIDMWFIKKKHKFCICWDKKRLINYYFLFHGQLQRWRKVMPWKYWIKSYSNIYFRNFRTRYGKKNRFKKKAIINSKPSISIRSWVNKKRGGAENWLSPKI